MYVVVMYEAAEGFLERRRPFRAAHPAVVEQWLSKTSFGRWRVSAKAVALSGS